jgi:hypothetical protein
VASWSGPKKWSENGNWTSAVARRETSNMTKSHPDMVADDWFVGFCRFEASRDWRILRGRAKCDNISCCPSCRALDRGGQCCLRRRSPRISTVLSIFAGTRKAERRVFRRLYCFTNGQQNKDHHKAPYMSGKQGGKLNLNIEHTGTAVYNIRPKVSDRHSTCEWDWRGYLTGRRRSLAIIGHAQHPLRERIDVSILK